MATKNPTPPFLTKEVEMQLKYMFNQLIKLNDDQKEEIKDIIGLDIVLLNSIINIFLDPNPAFNNPKNLESFYRKFQFLLEPKNYQISAEKQKMLIQWNKFDLAKFKVYCRVFKPYGTS
jgi:hypothetical protein